jgi:hypothetical protein
MRELSYSSTIFDLATRWRSDQLHVPDSLPPEERAFCTDLVGGWVDLVTFEVFDYVKLS